MIRLGFILALCICGSIAYNIAYDLEAMDREWSRSMSRRPVVIESGRGSSGCKKDMWILWDNSWSVGENAFEKKVRPFLKDLIKSSQLNVGPKGTHIGIITFSTQAQTRVLLELGAKQTPKELLDFLDGLKYNDLQGDGTRTGMAFKMVDEKFPKKSPQNYRPDVSDMVLIFTDGEPIRRPNEDPFGDKYKSNIGEELLAEDRAKNLRNNNVTVVGLALKKEGESNEFIKNIKEWATKGKYFATFKNKLKSVLKQLINASCVDPVECGCVKNISPVLTYVPVGGTASVSWKQPDLDCKSGKRAIIKSEYVEPPDTFPAELRAGQHTITYTYNYMRGTKVATLQCPIKIDVRACHCNNVVRVNAELAGGSSTASVSWQIPKPNCPARLAFVSPPEARNGRGNYPIGNHNVIYNYEHIGRTGSFSVRCLVKITVKGQLCRGVGFNPSRQACCCGTVHDKKANHACCGPDYYDTRHQRCEDFYTLVNN